MMERTVTDGTARRSFHDARGNAFLPGIRVAGKTGTLSGSDPYRGYTWWVGFAPADRPTIAVAALVVNTPRWRIKASYLARETLRYYLVERPALEAAQAAAAAAEAEPPAPPDAEAAGDE
jgi:cell division protein FtsI/penicillin-binding protein 2